MISQENREFVNFLFDKLVSTVDTDMLDLQDDDSCCDHINFEQLTYRDWETDRKSTRLNSSHLKLSRMPSSA